MKKRTFCLGDVHGAHKALVQVLERSGFDPEVDQLITLGDICDGWSEVSECVTELLKIPNRIDIVGNHDFWVRTWLETGVHPVSWMQGGHATAESYIRAANNTKLEYPLTLIPHMGGWSTNLCTMDIPKAHQDFFRKQNNYYIDEKNRLFVHGGFNRDLSIRECDPLEYCWDRSLWRAAMSCKGDQKLVTADGFSEIFIGHTATVNWGTDKPMNSGGVWNIDTGCGWNGKLTLMDIESHEYFQSDNVKDLYPGERGRG